MKNYNIKYILTHFDRLKDNNVLIRGRVTYSRGPFYDIEEGNEVIQVYLDKNVKEKYQSILKSGNIVEINGVPFKTKKEVPSISITNVNLKGKSYIPFKKNEENNTYHFIKGIGNRNEKNRILMPNLIINKIRNYLLNNNYYETHTGFLQTKDDGLNSSQFKVNGTKFHLRRDFDLETRLYLVYEENVFQMGKVFRNQGISQKNKNEFYYANLFSAYSNPHEMMTMFANIVNSFNDKIDLNELSEIQVIDYLDAILCVLYDKKIRTNTLSLNELSEGKFPKDLTKDSFSEKSMSKLLKILEKQKINLQESKSSHTAQKINDLFNKIVKRNVQKPTIFIGAPANVLPFAKNSLEFPFYGIDYRLIWKGKTIFHLSEEISDYIEQENKIKYIYRDTQNLSEGELIYLQTLKQGMHPFSGMSISLELLIQNLLDLENVSQVNPRIF